MGTQKRIIHSITDDQIWETINDEVALYLESYLMLRKFNRNEFSDIPTKDILRNALIESKAIHARNLCEIFLNESQNQDISLKNIVTPTWWSQNRSLIEILKGIYNPSNVDSSPKNILDKFLFHPTLNRAFRYDLRHPLQPLHKPIVKIIVALPNEKIPFKNNDPFLMS